MNSAPILRDEHKPILTGAYTAWAEHFNGCARCNAHDYFMPGAPVEIPESEALSHHTRMHDGTRYRYFSNWPDVSVLCSRGAMLFTQWVHIAFKSSTPRLEKPIA